ncbi:N-acetylmuramoyl-L-alanine amidase [Brevibacillus porteri]|uniref:N-acetylmuramoyl-L-alanine amidase n=1 Tax=Brevibacillus porteri TaxID=2126350 RepID=UPI003D218603
MDFITRIAPIAVAEHKRTGIPASLTLAQAIVESRSGTSELAVKANALFGVKGVGPAGSYEKVSDEYVGGVRIEKRSAFRKYNDWSESIRDHSEFLLKPRYSKVIGADWRTACVEISRAGYATDPNYAAKLAKVIEQYRLYEYDAEVTRKVTLKVAIDAGHGPDTPGKRTPDGSMREYHFNSAVAKRVRDLLAEYEGASVLFVHEDGRDVPLGERTDRANEWGANVYISIHADAAGPGDWYDANGITTFVYTKADGTTRKLADNVQASLIAHTGRRNRGVKQADFYVLRQTDMTAILCECGFMTNREEAVLLKSDAYRDKVARAIVEGLEKTYGIRKMPKEEPPVIEEWKRKAHDEARALGLITTDWSARLNESATVWFVLTVVLNAIKYIGGKR